jgi:hypothetical protein
MSIQTINITDSFGTWIQDTLPDKQQIGPNKIVDFENKIKILTALQFIKNNNIGIFLVRKMYDWGQELEIKLMNINTSEEIGRFNVDNSGPPNFTLSMYISSEIENQQLARLMVSAMCYVMIVSNIVRPDTLLYIDDDASEGFWERMGMQLNRTGDPQRRKYNAQIDNTVKQAPGAGKEKSIAFSNICLWALGIPGGNFSSLSYPITLANGGKKKIRNKSSNKKKNIKTKTKRHNKNLKGKTYKRKHTRKH